METNATVQPTPPPKVQELVVPPKEEEEEEEEQDRTGKGKMMLNERLINCVKKNQYEQVEKCLKSRADIFYEESSTGAGANNNASGNKKRWTCFIWACCLGHVRIVKLLMNKGAAQPFLEVKQENRYVAPGTTKQIRPNPLHWASFKGHIEVVSILLKYGLHWEDIDSCGNNSVMLSASANLLPIFIIYLQFGVSLECKNSRGHTAVELTTNSDILKLAHKSLIAKECAISKSPFKDKQIKNWCRVCGEFVCHGQYRLEWVLNNPQSDEREKIDGRCSKCWTRAAQIQHTLQACMDKGVEEELAGLLKKYEPNFDELEIVFLQLAKDVLHKFHVQNEIMAYIRSLAKVPDYKEILKCVNRIKKMLQDAQPLNISETVVAAAHHEIQKLNAERDLRFQIDNIDTSVATRQGVALLEQVYSAADQKGVLQEYLAVAGQIKGKMSKSILAQDIYKMFKEYPERPDPYPAPLVIDFKTKKPLDPETKKPTDPANLLPKKKKASKKTPPFAIPDWATDLKATNEKIKEEEDLLANRDQLGLSPEFCKQAQQMIDLMKKQSRYRKDIDTLQAMVDEANKKKK